MEQNSRLTGKHAYGLARARRAKDKFEDAANIAIRWNWIWSILGYLADASLFIIALTIAINNNANFLSDGLVTVLVSIIAALKASEVMTGLKSRVTYSKVVADEYKEVAGKLEDALYALETISEGGIKEDEVQEWCSVMALIRSNIAKANKYPSPSAASKIDVSSAVESLQTLERNIVRDQNKMKIAQARSQQVFYQYPVGPQPGGDLRGSQPMMQFPGEQSDGFVAFRTASANPPHHSGKAKRVPGPRAEAKLSNGDPKTKNSNMSHVDQDKEHILPEPDAGNKAYGSCDDTHVYATSDESFSEEGEEILGRKLYSEQQIVEMINNGTFPKTIRLPIKKLNKNEKDRKSGERGERGTPVKSQKVYGGLMTSGKWGSAKAEIPPRISHPRQAYYPIDTASSNSGVPSSSLPSHNNIYGVDHRRRHEDIPLSMINHNEYTINGDNSRDGVSPDHVAINVSPLNPTQKGYPRQVDLNQGEGGHEREGDSGDEEARQLRLPEPGVDATSDYTIFL